MTKKNYSVGIIDLTINNLFSIYRSCLKAGYKTEIIDGKKKNYDYDIIILPGVGAFKSGMNFLKKNHLNEKLYDYSEKSNSLIYGICLGMQLLFSKSNEFTSTKGLNFIEGEVVKFSKKSKVSTTHLGWNKFKIKNKGFKNIFRKFENKHFYFVHSYYVSPKMKEYIYGTSEYGIKNFCSIAKKKNIFGTQFHPEKSGLLGIEFLKNLKRLKN